jgi:hypothetical protein
MMVSMTKTGSKKGPLAGAAAVLCFAVALLVSGCGLDTTTGIEPRDCVPTEEGVPEGCPDEQPTESIVPIGAELQEWSR